MSLMVMTTSSVRANHHGGCGRSWRRGDSRQRACHRCGTTKSLAAPQVEQTGRLALILWRKRIGGRCGVMLDVLST